MDRSIETLITRLENNPQSVRDLRDQLVAHPGVLRQLLTALHEGDGKHDADDPSLVPLDPWLDA